MSWLIQEMFQPSAVSYVSVFLAKAKAKQKKKRVKTSQRSQIFMRGSFPLKSGFYMITTWSRFKVIIVLLDTTQSSSSSTCTKQKSDQQAVLSAFLSRVARLVDVVRVRDCV